MLAVDFHAPGRPSNLRWTVRRDLPELSWSIEPTGAGPTLYLQLAVSKQGILSGTLQNTAADSVQPIEGMVDNQTQRAAWTVAGKKRPLMETGVVNLTQDTTPALVHFADGTAQQWLLVRLEKPGEAAATPPR